MSGEVFWNLGLYDWTLWMEKIKSDREEKKTKEEWEWVRLSELLTPIYNFIYKKKDGQTWTPNDFFKPSWHKEERVIEKRTDKDILSKFPKKLIKKNGK